MATELATLIDTIKAYTPGDLVAGVEIQEMCDELLAAGPENETLKEQLEQVKEIFEAVAKNGIDEESENNIAHCVEKLEEHRGTESKEQGGEAPQQQTAEEGDYEVLTSFIKESQDHLEDIEEHILKLEKEAGADLVDSVFRSMHTIKGVASFLQLSTIKELSHALESVLDELRMERISINTDLIDVLLEGTDMLKALIAELSEKAETISQTGQAIRALDSGTDISHLTTRLEDLISGQQAADGEGEEARDNITPEMIENFVRESSDMLDKTENIFTSLRDEPENEKFLNDAFRTMHTVKGNAGFFGFSVIESLAVDIETVLDKIRKGERDADEHIISVLLGSIDAIRKKLKLVLSGDTEGTQEPLLEEFEEAAEAEQLNLQSETEPYKPLGERLIEMGKVSKADVEKALDLQQRRLGEILVDEGEVTEETVEKALDQQKKSVKAPTDQTEAEKTQRQDIRVDTEKLDKLFDLVGELITTEAMVIDNSDLKQYDFHDFDSATSYLSKVTREMQEITMSIRMIPLEGLFNKMRRLVRDLSRKFDKKINLSISGQDTEMDRNVMEEISDPLVHIIRNAVDHGIEDPETRARMGKEETGELQLNARYEGNEIWITVKDDGQGLNRERIIEKARQNGVLSTDPSGMSDQEVWKLIFDPGFSTSEEVSEISGRGVGMDVVKRNIEKLRGKIDMNSQEGEGTEIILRIPLTLAIIDGISLRVGNQLFSMPINDVLSFQKAEEHQLTQTEEDRMVLRLRDEIMPVIKLYEEYDISTEKQKITDGIVVVTAVNGKKAGLLVDDVVGYKQIVVKPLPEYVEDMKAIAGCSILGSGDVSLILDANALVESVIG